MQLSIFSSIRLVKYYAGQWTSKAIYTFSIVFKVYPIEIQHAMDTQYSHVRKEIPPDSWLKSISNFRAIYSQIVFKQKIHQKPHYCPHKTNNLLYIVDSEVPQNSQLIRKTRIISMDSLASLGSTGRTKAQKTLHSGAMTYVPLHINQLSKAMWAKKTSFPFCWWLFKLGPL